MSLTYKLLKVGKPGVSGSTKQFVRPSVIIQSTITPKEFINKFADTVRFSKADIVYFTYALKAFLLDELQNGNIVQTGVLGTFYPEINKPKIKRVNKKEDVDVEQGIRYSPSAEMKKEIKGWEIKRVNERK